MRHGDRVTEPDYFLSVYCHLSFHVHVTNLCNHILYTRQGPSEFSIEVTFLNSIGTFGTRIFPWKTSEVSVETEHSKHACSCCHMLQISAQLCPSVETPPLASSLSPHSLQNCLTYFQVTPHHNSIISFIAYSTLCSFARLPLFQCSASLCPTGQLRIRLAGF